MLFKYVGLVILHLLVLLFINIVHWRPPGDSGTKHVYRLKYRTLEKMTRYRIRADASPRCM